MTVSVEAYHAATSAAVIADRSANARLAIEGPDRAKFLHNLTTNEVKRLAEGRACEAFVTSPQGKTLAFVTLIIEPTRILLRTDPAALEGLKPHLQKYGLFDDVTITDITAETFEYHLAGPRSADWLRAISEDAIPGDDLLHDLMQIDEIPVRVLRESPTGRPGSTLIGSLEAKGRIESLLRGTAESLGGRDANDATYDLLRIEGGTPVFGRDLTADSLPQELGRDARAINFVKGCYLGQETVARIDALGHVNKVLKGWRLESEQVPAPGTALDSEGKAVGKVTSAAFSPGWNGTVGLAMVRTTHAQHGTALSIDVEGRPVSATIADLPMLPAAS